MVLRAIGMAGLILTVFHVLHGQLGLGGHGLDEITYNPIYDTVVLGAAASCLARGALVRAERLPWLVFGAALMFNAAGEIYYSIAFGDSGTPPIPSVADLLYLLYYPAAYVGLILLVRRRVRDYPASAWLDGAIAATTAAAVVAAVAFEHIARGAVDGGSLAVITTLAYPVGDVILLAIIVGALALSGWQTGRAWLGLAAALTLWVVADVGYALESAAGTYRVGGLLDSTWLVSALGMAVAAWQRPPPHHALERRATRLMAIPMTFALAGCALLVYGAFHHVGTVGVILASCTVVLVIVRAGWTFHENLCLLDVSQRDAVTDALTGLGNRRQMTAALATALEAGAESAPTVLIMFDLDGFKLYNDRFGHLAGDTMLAHLGARLNEEVLGIGSAFRLGGDEFCVLLRGPLERAQPRIPEIVDALCAEGDGFKVGVSHGVVELPVEAATPLFALRLADDRMYARKGARRGSAREQTHKVLLGLLREREPGLHEHLCQVGQLATDVAGMLELDPGQIDDIRRAAELHDIGKAAIPDAILSKTGPLDEHEWAFMRRHTLVGERILAAAPALAGIAGLVRSSHERWDGNGYPDGLADDAIPLGARIISVCDAFDAMVTARSYAPARSASAALAELRRVSGHQFDPAVVEAFCEVWRRRERQTGSAAVAA